MGRKSGTKLSVNDLLRKWIPAAVVGALAFALLYATQPRKQVLELEDSAPSAVVSREERRAAAKEKRQKRDLSQYTEDQYHSDFRTELRLVEAGQYGGLYGRMRGYDYYATSAKAAADGEASNKTHLITDSQCGPIGRKWLVGEDGVAKAAEPIEEVSSQYVFKYNEYTKYAHMAMIAVWGELLVAAWQASPSTTQVFNGPQDMVVEGLQEQRIMYSVSEDGGGSWTTPLTLPLEGRSGAVWSPVLHVGPDNRLWLLYAESKTCKTHSGAPGEGGLTWAPGGDIMVTILDSAEAIVSGGGGGKGSAGQSKPNWTKPRVIYPQNDSIDGIPKVLANKLVVLSTGEWVLPFWRELPDVTVMAEGCWDAAQGQESSGVLVSEDDGKTWTAYGAITDPRTYLLEGTIVELSSGELLMLLRSNTGCLFETTSLDKGRTWLPPRPSRLPNPNAKVHLSRLEPSGHLVLAFNNHKKPGASLDASRCKSCRSMLEVAVSSDNGFTWNRIAQVDAEVAPGIRIHYPTIVQKDDSLSVIYSRFYLYKDPGLYSEAQGIRVVNFDIRKLVRSKAAKYPDRPLSREALIKMIDHFIEVNPISELRKLGMRTGRWKRLTGRLCAQYDLAGWGGPKWLEKKRHLGNYAVLRISNAVVASGVLTEEERRQQMATDLEESETEDMDENDGSLDDPGEEVPISAKTKRKGRKNRGGAAAGAAVEKNKGGLGGPVGAGGDISEIGSGTKAGEDSIVSEGEFILSRKHNRRNSTVKAVEGDEAPERSRGWKADEKQTYWDLLAKVKADVESHIAINRTDSDSDSASVSEPQQDPTEAPTPSVWTEKRHGSRKNHAHAQGFNTSSAYRHVIHTEKDEDSLEYYH